MRFAFITKNKDMSPINRLCQIMNLNARSYPAFWSRPRSNSQYKYLVVLAHICEQFALSLGSNGRPRVTEELKDQGVGVGHRHGGRTMRENGIRVERSKNTRSQPIAITCSISHLICFPGTSMQRLPTRNGRGISVTSGRVKDGCICLSTLICILGALLAGQCPIQ